MISFSRKLVLLFVGLAVLVPLSTSAFAEPVTQSPSGAYNYYSHWSKPIESRTLYVSEYAKRDIQPSEVQVKETAPVVVTQSPSGAYNYYSHWSKPIESRTLYVSSYAKRDIQPSEAPAAKTAAAKPFRQYTAGPYNFYSDWMSPRVQPIEEKSFPFRTRANPDTKDDFVLNTDR